MRYFVPCNAHHTAPENMIPFIRHLREIKKDDVVRVVEQAALWNKDYSGNPIQAQLSQMPNLWSAQNTFVDAMRRPALGVYSASKDGSAEARTVRDLIVEMGREIKLAGYNYIYGGSDSGLMGLGRGGFYAEKTDKNKHPHQYCIQVTPSEFFVPKAKNEDEMRASNEGAYHGTDYAIITTSGFDNRTRIIDRHAVGHIVFPGSFGTNLEAFYALTLTKIGMRKTPLVFMNPRGYFDPLIKNYFSLMIDGFGFEKKEVRKFIHVTDKPKEALDIITSLQGTAHDLFAVRSAELDKAFRPTAHKLTGSGITYRPLKNFETLKP